MLAEHDLLAAARHDEIDWEHVAPLLGGRQVGEMIFVYFVAEEEDGAVKIGKARDPISRLRGLQTGNPRRLSIQRLIYGNEVVERLLHKYFESDALGGEWFRGEARDPMLRAADEILRCQHNLGPEITVAGAYAAVVEAMKALGYDRGLVADCDGSMTCECRLCRDERAARRAQGVRRSVQPWQSGKPFRSKDR